MRDALTDIRRLLPVLDTSFQAEQLKMARIIHRIEGLKTQLAALDKPEHFDPFSAASRGGADLLWETWVQNRKALINRELAFAYRDREGARDQMIAALSRLEAARQMEKRSASLARGIAARRASW